MAQQVEGPPRHQTADRWYNPIIEWFRWLGQNELSLILAGLFVAAAIWGFVELADDVTEGDTQSIDERIIIMLRNPDDLTDPIGPHWVEEMGRDFTALGGVGILVLLTLVLTTYLMLQRKYGAMTLLVVSVVGGVILSLLLKQGFDRPRPDLVPHGSYVATASFPSGHSMLSAVTYLTLGVLLARIHVRRRMKSLFLLTALLLTLLVGVSRVYLGVHWPTDVLGGWTVGLGWATLCWLVARWLQERGQVEEIDTQDADEEGIRTATPRRA